MTNSIETCEPKIPFSPLLELAASNDVEGFKKYIELNPNSIDETGLWYGRQAGARGMILEQRTPLMVASMYGSLDVLKFMLSLSEVNVNQSFGPDKSTALHCAVSGASDDAIDVVKLLLANGADPNLIDAKGNRPYDVISVSRLFPRLQFSLEELLRGHQDLPGLVCGSMIDSLSVMSLSEANSESNGLETPSSPLASKISEKKEYPVDPSIPDIKNSIYGTDEFRMYSFKVRPCSRAYSHDWTECPFVHPGENARRRDPRKYHYSCVPCPDFRKGSCRRGDMCEYAHGVFECWLHPAQYRTRLCKDGTSCDRRVCFFAHTTEELRPLYASTGSAASPRAAVMDMAAALNIFPCSPSAASAGMSPSPFTPPMSPSGNNGMPQSPSAWQQQNMSMPPALHLPISNMNANNFQTSRLRSSLNARDIPVGDLDFEQLHILNDMSCYSQPQFNSARSKTMTPSNLDDIFSIEVSSPRFCEQIPVFSPSHKSAVLNHFQQQQNLLSPINTKVFPAKSTDHPLLQASFGPSSPRIMSPQSPLSAHARLSALALREKQQQIRSMSARDLGAHIPRDLIPDSAAMAGSPVGLWSKWGSSNGRPDWSTNVGEIDGLKRPNSVNGFGGEEPDLSWVQSLVKDSSSEKKDLQKHEVSGVNPCGHGSNSNSQAESADHSGLGAWLDQIVAL